MKTILVLIALTGFTAAGGYAQNKTCTNTPAQSVKKAPAPTCFTLKKENFDIPGCMDVTYGSSHSYLGNYPKKTPAIPGIKCVKTATPDKIAGEKEAADLITYPVPQIIPAIIPVADELTSPCYTYKQNNIVVKQCPGVFYDSNAPLISNDAGMMEYNSSDTYMGNYPQNRKSNDNGTDETGKQNQVVPMENRPIEGYNLPANNLYYWDSYQNTYNTK